MKARDNVVYIVNAEDGIRIEKHLIVTGDEVLVEEKEGTFGNYTETYERAMESGEHALACYSDKIMSEDRRYFILGRGTCQRLKYWKN